MELEGKDGVKNRDILLHNLYVPNDHVMNIQLDGGLLELSRYANGKSYYCWSVVIMYIILHTHIQKLQNEWREFTLTFDF